MMARPLSAFDRLREAAEQKTRERAGLQRVQRDDFAALASKSGLASNTQVASKSEPLASKFASKPEILASKSASEQLPAGDPLPANAGLPANDTLPASERSYPSWQVPKVTIRIPEGLQQTLRFIGLSRGLSFQDTVLLAIHGLLATEGLPANGSLPANGACQPTDQMIDDVGITLTSSVRPEALLDYYAKWTDNPIREGDWKALRSALGFSAVAVKAGILMSILRTATRVNSFKYCLGAIQEVAKSGIITSETYLRYLEAKVEQQRAGKGGK